MKLLLCCLACAVINEGILYGVAGIDVVVNSDSITDAIKRRLVDANVPSTPLACQLNQVADLKTLLCRTVRSVLQWTLYDSVTMGTLSITVF